MDAFYASVEVLLDPALAGRPLIVGGTGPRGVVASCSYEARAYGVRSAMPSVQARRLCPHATFVPGHHGIYAEYSARIHAVFQRYTPLVEGIALDEAFLDVTGVRRLHGTAPEVAAAIRAAVDAELGLRCSVGVGPNKLLAKLASKAAKPLPPRPGASGVGPEPPVPPGASRPFPGVVVVAPGDVLAFLHPLPARALWGLGPATFARLSRYGVQTVGDLAALPAGLVVRALGTAVGTQLHQLAHGVDDRPVEPERPVKSIGHEETYATDHHELGPLDVEAVRMGDAVADRLRRAGVAGRTVSIKVRFADFRTITRSRTLARPVDAGSTIAAVAAQLLAATDVADDVAAQGVRLFGVTVSGLGPPEAEQLDLFATLAPVPPAPGAGAPGPGAPTRGQPRERARAGTRAQARDARKATGEAAGESAAVPPDEQQRALADAVDAVRSRFGRDAVGPAVLADAGQLRLKREGDTRWGPDARD